MNVLPRSRAAADVERRVCAVCAKRRAATRLGLTICVVCAGILKPIRRSPR